MTDVEWLAFIGCVLLGMSLPLLGELLLNGWNDLDIGEWERAWWPSLFVVYALFWCVNVWDIGKEWSRDWILFRRARKQMDAPPPMDPRGVVLFTSPLASHDHPAQSRTTADPLSALRADLAWRAARRKAEVHSISEAATKRHPGRPFWQPPAA